MRPRRVQIGAGHEDEPASPGEEGRDHGRPVLRRSAIAVGLLGIALLSLSLVNLFMLDSESVRAWIEPRAEQALNRPVTLGAAHVSVWPGPSVRLTDVRIGSPPGFHGFELGQVDAARLDLAWLPLVIGRVHARRLVLEGARIQLAVDEHGRSNFGDLVPRAGERIGGASAAPLALRIDDVVITDGSLGYFDAARGRSVLVDGLVAEAELAQESEGWRTTVAARSDSLLLRLAGVGEEIVRSAGPTIQLRIGGGRQAGTFEIDEGHVAFATDTLSVGGSLSVGSEPGFDISLRNDHLSPSVLTSFFTSDARSDLLPRAEGRLDVAIWMRGGGRASPFAHADVRLEDVALRLRGDPFVDRVSGKVAVTADTITFDSLAGRFAGGPFELSGTFARSTGATAVELRGEPDLTTFDRLDLLPEGMSVSGATEVSVSLASPVADLDSVQLEGVAHLDGVRVEHPRLGVPVYVRTGEVTFVGREARWSDVSALLGADPFVTSGNASDILGIVLGEEGPPVIDASFAAPHVDLDAVLPPRDTSVHETYAQLAFAHLGSRVVEGRPASVIARERGLARPERLPARGAVSFEIDTLAFRVYELEKLAARVELGDTTLAVPTASFETWGGTGSGSMRLDVGPTSEGPFALDVSLRGARARPFLSAMSPVGEQITGTLDIDLEVAGMIDSSFLPVAHGLSGDVSVRLEDGHVEGTGMNMALADFLGADAWMDVAFATWQLDLGIEDRVVQVREASLVGETGDVHFSGPVHLDGSTDLSMGLSIPARRLADASLRRTGIGPRVLERLRASGDPLDLGLRVGGTLRAPTLEPDALNAVALAGP